MILANPRKAEKFFRCKMEFTTGPMELDKMMKGHENINIVDVRMPVDYAAGHISGAINLPRENWNTLMGLRKDKTNVVYCYSEVCHLAAAASQEFAAHGFSVMELEGGFAEWKRCNLPIEN